MKNLDVEIKSAELRYKQILEDFFITVYGEENLLSHGLGHHRRVWHYAKELLVFLQVHDTHITSQLPSQLIIACYLHDIGMSVDPGLRHGKYSKELCINFLSQNHLKVSDYIDAIEAIENHDRKDYTGDAEVSDLLTVLSVADDLDAFGLIGIYRYSEIYLTRKTEPEKIGLSIGENAQKRYDNFIKIYGSVDELVIKHWERYYLLKMFFDKYNEQLPFYLFGTSNPSGFCGVIEIIKLTMNNDLQIKDICSEPEKFTNDPLIIWFFGELEKELSVL